MAVAAELVVSCVRKLQRDRAWQMASALSYQTLFSLLPLLVLALIVLNSVAGLENAPLKLENLAALCSRVRETGADLGVAFDGDADRAAARALPRSGSWASRYKRDRDAE